MLGPSRNINPPLYMYIGHAQVPPCMPQTTIHIEPKIWFRHGKVVWKSMQGMSRSHKTLPWKWTRLCIRFEDGEEDPSSVRVVLYSNMRCICLNMFCVSFEYENEEHLVLECPLYNSIGNRFPSIFQNVVLICNLNSFFKLYFMDATTLHYSKEF